MMLLSFFMVDNDDYGDGDNDDDDDREFCWSNCPNFMGLESY
jgi:hypothetical protein